VVLTDRWSGPIGSVGVTRDIGPRGKGHSTLALIALCGVASLLVLTLLPIGALDVVGDWATHGLRWEDRHIFVGNCTQHPVHDYFFVNETALAIDISVDFTTNTTFPGASLTIFGPDGFVVFSKDLDQMHYHSNITDITKRGRWKMALSVNYCSFEHPFEYTVHVTVENRYIAPPTTDGTEVKAGDTVFVLVEGLNLSQGEQCRLDLGDGTVTPWFDQGAYPKAYSRPGTYSVRAMVRSPDGTTTGWSGALNLRIVEKGTGASQREDLSTNGMAVAVALICLLALVAYLTSKR